MSSDEWVGFIIVPIGVTTMGSLIVWLWCNAAPDDHPPEADTDRADLGRRE